MGYADKDMVTALPWKTAHKGYFAIYWSNVPAGPLVGAIRAD